MVSSNSNKRKDELLGEPHGTAANRLRKMLLFQYVQWMRHDICHRCQKPIERVEDLSIEHKAPWQSAGDPRAAFFDLKDIGFSHLRCNVQAGDRSEFIARNKNRAKTHCDSGHAFDAANTLIVQHERHVERRCRTCDREAKRAGRAVDPTYCRPKKIGRDRL